MNGKGLSKTQAGPGKRAVLAAGAVVLGLALLQPLLLPDLVEHRYYQTSFQTSVETWDLHLPFGFRAERRKSSPAGPEDGIRLLRREAAAPVTANPDRYSALKPGMTYTQAAALMGGEGALLPNTDGRRDTVRYIWANADQSTVEADFQNGRLVSKRAFGLAD